MSTSDVDGIKKELADINTFVRERLDPVTDEVDVLREVTEKLGREVVQLQERERSARRELIAKNAEAYEAPVVTEGPYSGMDVLDLGLLRRLARSQRRESFGPAWLERAEDAKRSLVASMTPELIQGSYQLGSRRLSDWYTVDKKPTGQFESFSRSVLQSMTRAAMDSTTAGSGDELVATLEARQLGDVSFYPGTENVATTSTALSTGKTTLTAYELVGQTPYSFTLEEDAVIAMLPEIRAGLVRNVAEVLDDIILNADTTTTDNINADGATISASDAGKGH